MSYGVPSTAPCAGAPTAPLPSGPPDHQALLGAFRAAGAAQGIRVVEPPPAAGELTASRYARALAAASRFRVREVVLREGWWRKDAGPLVALSDERGPVALLPTAPGAYQLLDPGDGTRTPVDDRVASTLQPRAFMLYRPFAERALRSRDLLAFGLRGQRGTLRLIALGALLSAALGMLLPAIFGFLVDSVIPDANRELLMQLAGALAGAAFGRALFELAEGYAVVRLESASAHDTQAAVWDRLLAMGPAFFRRYPSGDLVARGLSVSEVHRKLSGATLRSLLAGSASVINLALLFWYGGMLALLAVGAAAVVAAVTLALGALSLRQLVPLQALEGSLLGFTTQLVQGVSKLRVSGGERAAFARWARRFAEQQRRRQAVQRLEDAQRLLGELLPVLSSTLLFWLASRRLVGDAATSGAMSTGAFLAFNAALGAFVGGLTSLGETLVESLRELALLERAEPILAGEPEVDSRKADPGVLLGRLEVDRLSFRYRRDGPLALAEVSLRVAPGEFVAIVGPSGSGKSTLLRVLLGFEQPESGGVYYDGQDLAGLDVHAVRRQLGVVLQGGNILTGSILENIAAGASLTLDDAWAAARDAGLEDDLAALPMGMHTIVSEGGTNFSGGQRQRLLIARALARRPRVVFFDEATSALDNRTQAIVTSSLDRLRVTRVVVAHRLSTIQKADRVYVLDAGRLVQQGAFAELASQDGLLARMMARQML
jgi:NHLM bacteriocin system ABC transporter ATP-binding protein